MTYYYNETEHSFAVTTNFKYNPVPKGFVEITKEEYERLKEEENNKENNKQLHMNIKRKKRGQNFLSFLYIKTRVVYDVVTQC